MICIEAEDGRTFVLDLNTPPWLPDDQAEPAETDAAEAS